MYIIHNEISLLYFSDTDILECTSGLIRTMESRSFHVMCLSFSSSPAATLHWQIQPWHQNQTLQLVCSSDNHSCTSHPEVQAHMFGNVDSDLTIPRVERGMFNSSTLTCSVTSRDKPDWSGSDSCLIDVTCKYISAQCVEAKIL